ncbi:hypothetical protein BDY19DRAFT_990279 [Irpex rosettiformis]|uniref:Uncharacterized protein n=1 Tax=Irpex rosettiformis TaxID=378272 RepID=A0ACB8UDZ8_9APHY|nr:hypothetical protein BDY19DRAFT_990279 [Irpex rosettiformis]
MATPDYFDAPVRWPHSDASTVIVTGEFDSWSGKQRLTRTVNGFEGTIKIPWARKTPYKYIVDGRWTTTDHQPTEYDSIGNLNNVFYSPARPAVSAVQHTSTPMPVESSKASNGISGINGILTNAKNAAVAMVEALAPGTTETPQPTPAIGTDSVKEEVLGRASAVQKQAVKPAVATAEVVAKTVQPKAELNTAPIAELEPTPAQAVVSTPKEEVNAEAVLPVSREEAPAAPVVPVPVLPLAEERSTIGDAEKGPETKIVPGAATSESSTHTPADAVTPAIQPSTHTPAANGTVLPAAEAPAILPVSNGVHDGPSTHSPVVLPTRKSDVVPPVVTNGVNAADTEKTAEVPLPAPTPPEAPPVPTTPKLNGTSAEPPSTTSSPASSPRKEKKGSFPTFGRHHRQSSTASVSTNSSSPNTPNELGVLDSPSRKGTMKKKRTSSIFGKVKHLFTDEAKKEKKGREASS